MLPPVTQPRGVTVAALISAIQAKSKVPLPPDRRLRCEVERFAVSDPRTGHMVVPRSAVSGVLKALGELSKACQPPTKRGGSRAARLATIAAMEQRAAATRQAEMNGPTPTLYGHAIDVRALKWDVPATGHVRIADMLMIAQTYITLIGAPPVSNASLRILLRPFAVKVSAETTNRVAIPGRRLPDALAAIRERVAIGVALIAAGEDVNAGTVGMLSRRNRAKSS
jgi:hypothetical protein